MSRRRSLPSAVLLALALVVACALGSGGRALALPGDPTPSARPSATPATNPVDLSGHWETDDFGGMDLVQQGTTVRGSSPAGVSFEGTLAGRRVDFTFWHGASYAKADEENRGRGSMTLGADGRTLTVTWQTEEKPSPYNGSFTAIRVGPQIPLGPTGSEPTAAPSPAAAPPFDWDQSYAALMMVLWQAIYFGGPLPAYLEGYQIQGDVQVARYQWANALAALSMGVKYGPDWMFDPDQGYTRAFEYFGLSWKIEQSMKVPLGGPQATQPPWWNPLTDPDFPWDKIDPPPTGVPPMENPPASGDPLQNP